MALGVLAWISFQHSLAHVVHGHHVVGAGEEGLGVHRDVVVQGGHHVGEVVEAIALEHGVHHLQHLPHVGADALAGEVAGETHGLLVELHDAVGEDVMDGLQDDGLERGVDLRPLLHDGQDGLHGVQEAHGGDCFLVPGVSALQDLGEGSHEMLADVDSHGDQLLSVGADDLLHDGGQVVVLCLPDNLQQLQRDLPDLRLQVFLGEVALAGEHHLDSNRSLHLHRRLLVVQEAGDGQSEGLRQHGLVLILDVREVVKDPAGSGSQMAVRGVELWEDNLHQELLHLLLVDRLFKQDVRHCPDHVEGSVLLARSCPVGLNYLQQKVHRLLQHLLPAVDQ